MRKIGQERASRHGSSVPVWLESTRSVGTIVPPTARCPSISPVPLPFRRGSDPRPRPLPGTQASDPPSPAGALDSPRVGARCFIPIVRDCLLTRRVVSRALDLEQAGAQMGLPPLRKSSQSETPAASTVQKQRAAGCVSTPAMNVRPLGAWWAAKYHGIARSGCWKRHCRSPSLHRYPHILRAPRGSPDSGIVGCQERTETRGAERSAWPQSLAMQRDLAQRKGWRDLCNEGARD